MISNDMFLLILGAILGFASALTLEFARYWLTKKRLKSEEEKENLAKEQEALTEFLSKDDVLKSLALVTLKKTPKPPLVNFGKKHEVFHTVIVEVDDLSPDDNTTQRGSLSNSNEKYMIKKVQIIGRNSNCEIQIRDDKASRKHAMIRFENGNYVIYDLDSTNGTFVNGKRLLDNEGVTLAKDDLIRIGRSEFVFGLIRPPDNRKPKDLNKTQRKKLV